MFVSTENGFWMLPLKPEKPCDKRIWAELPVEPRLPDVPTDIDRGAETIQIWGD